MILNISNLNMHDNVDLIYFNVNIKVFSVNLVNASGLKNDRYRTCNREAPQVGVLR